ncbi:ComEA family DNA-binding protein [Rhizomonospora bruguierae]|uniref:ComEA family DNA-binding protein n=1 Tax=Rhizomonospora bruguierae TaxID=1581705 RepID=UPI001BCAF77E|nr:ComEA family DNA-binding protein [Micromonospora sp. NBRC 107566]
MTVVPGTVTRIRPAFGTERPATTDPAPPPSSPPPSSPASTAEAAAGAAVPGLAPASLSAGAFDPGRRGVRALVAVGVVVVLIAAVLAWRARPHADPVAEPAAATAQPAGQPADPPSSAPAAEVVVAVVGKVRRPGLVRLPAGARVADAIEAAGGLLPGTDIALLNLARKVTDGELIAVGITAPPGAEAGGGATGVPAAGGGGPLNLNTATLAQLDALPGVGPVLAQRILDYREAHGGFRSVSELRQVQGIGNARYDDLKSLVTV